MSSIKTIPVKEFELDNSKLPPNLGGPKYTFGTSAGGYHIKSKRLTAYRRFETQERPEPGLIAFCITIGQATGVKLDPPRVYKSVNKTFCVGPGSYDPVESYKVPPHIMAKREGLPRFLVNHVLM